MFRRLNRSIASLSAFSGTVAAAAAPSARFYAAATSSATSKDFYKVLGVERNSNAADIKRAYRKRALETHPDQGGKQEDFQRVAEAYEVLSNAEKRQVYDQYGAEAVNGMGMGGGGPGGGMGGMGRNAEDIFREFFRASGGNPFGGAEQGPRKVAPAEARLRLSLEDLYKGVSRAVRVSRPQICGDCRGHGTKSQQPKPKCTACGGAGSAVRQFRMGPGMVQQVLAQCEACNGTGSVAQRNDQCSRCSGEGHRVVAQDVNVKVPPGVPSGTVLVAQGEGGTIPDAEPGDLHVHIEQVPHPVFERRGRDLIVRHDATLSEALLGVTKTLKLLDGRTVTLKTAPAEAVVGHDSVIRVAGEGMPDLNGSRGDLLVFVRVVMPRELTKEQRAAIEGAFGAPKAPTGASDEPGATVVGRVMRETREQVEAQRSARWADEASGNNGSGGRRAGNGRHGGGSQQMECAQQ